MWLSYTEDGGHESLTDVDAVLSLTEVRYALPHRLCDVGQFVGPEDEEPENEDYEKLEAAYAEQNAAL